MAKTKVIVRTPETDRKVIEIPTKLTDLTDYVPPVAMARCGIYDDAAAWFAADADAIYGPTDPVPFPKTNYNVGCTIAGGTITVPNTGMYIITVVFTWVDWGGTASHPAPTPATRTVLLLAGSQSFPTQSSGNNDGGTFIVSLTAGDTVHVSATQTMALGTESGNWTGSLALLQVAP